MFNILFVGHDASITGAPLYLLELIKQIKKHYPQYRLRLLLKETGALLPAYKRLINIEILPTTGLYAFSNKFLNYAPDIIYANTSANLETLCFIQKCYPQTPLLLHIHELKEGLNANKFSKILTLINNPMHFIAVSSAVKHVLTHQYKIAPKKIIISQPFLTQPDKKQQPSNLRKRLGIPAQAPIICSIGTICLRKGVDIFIKVGERVLKEYPTVHFVWTGAVAHSGDEKVFKKMLRLSPYAKNIHLLHNESARELLKECTVYCHPAREDAFPITCVEAGALGKPVICFSKTGGAEEYVKLAAHGMIVPYLNTTLMAKSIEQYIHQPQNENKKIAKKIITHFSTQKGVSQIMTQIHAVSSM